MRLFQRLLLAKYSVKLRSCALPWKKCGVYAQTCRDLSNGGRGISVEQSCLKKKIINKTPSLCTQVHASLSLMVQKGYWVGTRLESWFSDSHVCSCVFLLLQWKKDQQSCVGEENMQKDFILTDNTYLLFPFLLLQLSKKCTWIVCGIFLMRCINV